MLYCPAHPEVVDALGSVDENELVVCEPAEFGAELFDIAAMPDRLGVLVPERADHSTTDNGKRYQPLRVGALDG
jgi:hypothetical protein